MKAARATRERALRRAARPGPPSGHAHQNLPWQHRSRPSVWYRIRHRRRRAADRFGLLLLILVIAYVVSAFVSSPWVNFTQIVLFLAAAGLAVRTTRLQPQTLHLIIVVAAIGSASALTLVVTHSRDAAAGAAEMWAAVTLLFAVVLIVRRVLSYRTVTIQSIYGAVSAYMILGLMFAAIYTGMYRFGGNTFFAGGQPGNVKTFQYFSFTTLTTLGYGDFTAAGSGGQAIAVIEAMTGQIFLATLVARLVAAFRGPGPARARRTSRSGTRKRPGSRIGPVSPRQHTSPRQSSPAGQSTPAAQPTTVTWRQRPFRPANPPGRASSSARAARRGTSHGR
jgi:hypothetical protein